MTQCDLNRAVARATGEPVERIANMGFNEVVVPRHVPWWRARRWRRGRRARLARQKAKSDTMPSLSAS